MNQTTHSQWSMGGSIRTSSCETLSNITCFVSDSINLYLGANNVKCSTNNGMKWIEAGIVGFDFDVINDLEYHNNLIYASSTEGLYISPGYEIGWGAIHFGLPSKRTTALLFSNNTLFVGTYYQGVCKTSNFGKTWQATSPDTLKQFIRTLDYYKNTLIIGSFNGIFKSTNDGYSWSEISNGLDSKEISCILVMGNTLYAGTNDTGLYKSIDEGKTWIKLKNLKTSGERVFSLLTISNVIFAGTDDGIYMSKDDGETWVCANHNFNDILKDLWGVAMTVKDGYLIAGITGGELYVITIPLSYFGIKLDPSISGSTISCIDYPSKFSTKPESNVTISWSVENGKIIGSNSETVVNIMWDKTDEGKVILTKENKSLNIKDSTFKMVQIINKPDKPTIIRKDNTLISSASFGNQWYWNGKPILKATGQTYDAYLDGKYTLDVYFNDFHSDMSDTLDFTYTGYYEDTFKPEIVISPNPASDYIEISVGAQRAVPDGVVIYDLLGVEVNNSTLTPTLSLKGEGVRIDISSLSPGMYFVRLGDKVQKFVKI